MSLCTELSWNDVDSAVHNEETWKLPKDRDKQNNLSETKEKLGELVSFSGHWLKEDAPGWAF